jgi:hypothetical protein
MQVKRRGFDSSFSALLYYGFSLFTIERLVSINNVIG